MTLLAIALAAMVAVQLPPSSARKSGEYSCRSTDGATINVTPSPGKALVLAFVNTECGSCLKVTLRLIEVYKSLPSREQAAFMVIAVNQDAAEKLPRFIQDVTLPFQACTGRQVQRGALPRYSFHRDVAHAPAGRHRSRRLHSRRTESERQASRRPREHRTGDTSSPGSSTVKRVIPLRIADAKAPISAWS